MTDEKDEDRKFLIESVNSYPNARTDDKEARRAYILDKFSPTELTVDLFLQLVSGVEKWLETGKVPNKGEIKSLKKPTDTAGSQ